MNRGLFILLLCLVFKPVLCWSKTNIVESVTTGFGGTYQEALASALLEAVRQVNGVIVGNEKNIKVEFEQLTEHHKETKLVKVGFSEDVYVRSKGAIKSYAITNFAKPTKDDSSWRVTVKASIPRYISKTGKTKLPSLAILPFHTNQSVLQINQSGLQTSAVDFPNHIKGQLINIFTQSNFFNVLSRSFEHELSSEKALLNSDKVPAIEASRLGQLIGADFILLGSIDNRSTKTKISKLYGLKKSITTDHLDLSYQLVEVATQQIFWADSISINVQNANELNAGEFYKSVAQKVAENILDVIHPIQIMKASNDNELFLNQGKARVKLGEIYAIFDIGTTLNNPANEGEVLVRGKKLGELEIKTVFAKYATAQLTSGNINLVAPGATVQKIRLEKQKHPSFNKEVRATEGSSEAPIKW